MDANTAVTELMQAYDAAGMDGLTAALTAGELVDLLKKRLDPLDANDCSVTDRHGQIETHISTLTGAMAFGLAALVALRDELASYSLVPSAVPSGRPAIF